MLTQLQVVIHVPLENQITKQSDLCYKLFWTKKQTMVLIACKPVL